MDYSHLSALMLVFIGALLAGRYAARSIAPRHREVTAIATAILCGSMLAVLVRLSGSSTDHPVAGRVAVLLAVLPCVAAFFLFRRMRLSQ
jgi:hypothetical protein